MKCEDLSTMQKCIEKTTEIVELLKTHGVRVYQIDNLSVQETDLGIATLEVNLDFRKKRSS